MCFFILTRLFLFFFFFGILVPLYSSLYYSLLILWRQWQRRCSNCVWRDKQKKRKNISIWMERRPYFSLLFLEKKKEAMCNKNANFNYKIKEERWRYCVDCMRTWQGYDNQAILCKCGAWVELFHISWNMMTVQTKPLLSVRNTKHWNSLYLSVFRFPSTYNRKLKQKRSLRQWNTL